MANYVILSERKGPRGTEVRVKCADCPRATWKLKRNLTQWQGRCRPCALKHLQKEGVRVR